LSVKPHDADLWTVTEKLGDHRSDARPEVEDHVTAASREAMQRAFHDEYSLVLKASDLGGIGWTVDVLAHCSLRLRKSQPTPEWGFMILEARNVVRQAGWMPAFPGLAIILNGIAFSILDDGLADRAQSGR